MTDLITATVQSVRANIPTLGIAKLGPEYNYQSLPLCVIDAVFSIGVRYVNAQKAVTAWCNAQRPVWVKHRAPGQPRKMMTELVQKLEGLSDADMSNHFFGGNRQRTSSKSGIMKSEAVARFARSLVDTGIEDFVDIKSPDKVARGRRAIESIPGQQSGKSFDYFLMLAGEDDFVKADRMICRFVATAANRPSVTEIEAQGAIKGACDLLKSDNPCLTPRLLDHVIWQYQRAVSDTK